VIAEETARSIAGEVERFPGRGREFRQRVMERLGRLPGWDWVGVYCLDGDVLVLDAFVGEPTEHRRIPVGVGVCGTAVAENRNQCVPDVSLRSNYLACSWKTRSELVVLIRREGAILGQIDVDGHQANAFDATDEAFLEVIATILARRWADLPGPAELEPGT